MQKPSNGTCPQDSRILGRLHGICSEINFHFTGVVPVSSIFDPEPAGGGSNFRRPSHIVPGYFFHRPPCSGQLFLTRQRWLPIIKPTTRRRGEVHCGALLLLIFEESLFLKNIHQLFLSGGPAIFQAEWQKSSKIAGKGPANIIVYKIKSPMAIKPGNGTSSKAILQKISKKYLHCLGISNGQLGFPQGVNQVPRGQACSLQRRSLPGTFAFRKSAGSENIHYQAGVQITSASNGGPKDDKLGEFWTASFDRYPNRQGPQRGLGAKYQEHGILQGSWRVWKEENQRLWSTFRNLRVQASKSFANGWLLSTIRQLFSLYSCRKTSRHYYS